MQRRSCVLRDYIHVSLRSTWAPGDEVPSAADAPEIVHDEEVVTVATTWLVPKKLLTGKGYTIQPEASIHRARAFYEGEFVGVANVVVGTRQLMERIDEVTAVHTLRAMKKTRVYCDGQTPLPMKWA